MFLAVAPLALKISSRNEEVLPQAINFVINPASRVLIPAMESVLPLSMFGAIFI